jgi:hypothetical protein
MGEVACKIVKKEYSGGCIGMYFGRMVESGVAACKSIKRV